MSGSIISEDLGEELVTTARTAVGESLRSLTYFTRANFEQLYLREDLERDADLDTFVGHEWRGFKQTDDAYQESELGQYQYTIRAFENGYLLRVTTDRHGVLITTDGLTMNDFDGAAEAIKRMLRDQAE